ncbi:MAG: DUF502 domain-containing protein [Gammaproteobacteria bacterium]|nr:DUF502 domain-containing protein [Gammaproteobacteria bacterium]
MIRRYFIAGLLVLLPIWATLLIIKFMVNLVDQSLSLLPKGLHPDVLLGVHIPGLGLIFTLAIVLLTGMLVTNFIGHWFLGLWEGLLARIPLVRSIYTAVKQVLNTLFTPGGESFRKVLLIEYPRKDVWTIGFQTGAGITLPGSQAQGELVTVFVPTTPNPTAGFLLLVPKQQVVELKMSIDQALKYVISLGVVLPPFMAEQMLRTNKESI